MKAKIHPPKHPLSAGNSPQPERVPALRHHKASGQAFVILNAKTTYLGRSGLEETTRNYHRVIAEWIANGRQLQIDPQHILVKEMLARFWLHAEKHYVRSNGRASSELGNYQVVIKFLKQLYADTNACEFGPMALRVIREQMVQKGWCRKSVNRMTGRVKSIFRWATEQELIPGTIWHALLAVAGLRAGYSEAPESSRVRPVPMELVNAVKPFVNRRVWAMIELQRLTAARPGELCIMRRCDVDRSGPIWMYKPTEHKTAHLEHERIIYIGPQGQDILTPFLLRAEESYCFSPAEAMKEYLEDRHEARETPPTYGNRRGKNINPNPERPPGDHYDVASYRRAIERACERAFAPPEHLRPRLRADGKKMETPAQFKSRLSDEEKAELRAWRKAHRWHPHQLRHNAATELRKEFGLDTARIILGHHSPAITLIYAEADQKKALEAMMKVG